MKLNEQQEKEFDLIDKMQVAYINVENLNKLYRNSHTLGLEEDLGFNLSCILKLEPYELNPIYRFLAVDILRNKSFYLQKAFSNEEIGLTVGDNRYLIKLLPCLCYGEKSLRIVFLKHNNLNYSGTDFQMDLNIDREETEILVSCSRKDE